MLEWLKKKFKNEEKPNQESKTDLHDKNDLDESFEEIEKESESQDRHNDDSLKACEEESKNDGFEQENKEEDELDNSIGNIKVVEESSPQEEPLTTESFLNEEEGDSTVLEKNHITKDSPNQADTLDFLENNSVDRKDVPKTLEHEEEVIQEKPKEKPSFFQKLKSGLSKTRNDMGNKINGILGSYVKIDDEMMEDLEDILISADIGMETTMELVDRLKERIARDKIKDPLLVKNLLAEEMGSLLQENAGITDLNIDPSPGVILIVGVNGVGKTTTIGKLTQQLKNEGKSVLIAAGDTFRAAAIEQLKTWGQRSNTDVIAHQEGADPAAVIYDAIQAAKSRKVDVLICDTAGRLHNKKNLMNELEKIHRIISRDFPEARKEVLLVLDATTGQNAIIQAKTFNEVTELTGIVLTKLDGTAKGGVVLPLVSQLSIPIKFIGVGEGIDDLQKFNEEDFAKALLDID